MDRAQASKIGAVTFEDHFGGVAQAYREFRPEYPDALFDHLAGLCVRRQRAWDCACGSGQATLALAARFEEVIATDASREQLALAPAHPRVAYRVVPAEASGIESASVDLITVAQALHWFDLAAFYAEVWRVARSGAVLAAWSYGVLRIEAPAADAVARNFYECTLGPFWPPERRIVESGYSELDFPFEPLAAPQLDLEVQWTLAQLLGYFRSWSAVRRYRRSRGEDPVVEVAAQLARVWGDPAREYRVVWPLALRVGRVRE